MNREYEVEQIVKRSRKGDRFLVKWRGFSSDNNTWELVENLVGCRDVVDAFIKNEMTKKRQLNDNNSSPSAHSSSSPRKYSLRTRQTSTPQKTPVYQPQTNRENQVKEGNSRNLTTPYKSIERFSSGQEVTHASNRSDESSPGLSPSSNQQGSQLVDALKRPSIKLQRPPGYGGKPSLTEELEAPAISQKSEIALSPSPQTTPSPQTKPIGDPPWLHLEWTDVIGAILLTVLLASAVAFFQRWSLEYDIP